MDPITRFRGKSVAIPQANIDTDQITPARFLKGTEKKGLGKILFYDWRYNPDGTPKPDFPLNRPGAQGASILVAGDNYGCGSSREHAPWAMYDFGIRAVISTSIADIHRNNCLKNGILPILVDPETHRECLAAAEKNLEFEIDLPSQTLTLPSGKKVSFPIDPFAKRCLVQGVDELGYLLAHRPAIEAYEAARAAAGPAGR
ncbi:MAG TPA: 3-isopropylmalate dehydratase small subunit [Planctomycetota bacterium]|jgi:3-isopropylmalate/(R)-2-methylmalate dehydratase small subunit|nr:3-isopropylmalate dehydratase small subunit [Planctomycetota bacterium]